MADLNEERERAERRGQVLAGWERGAEHERAAASLFRATRSLDGSTVNNLGTRVKSTLATAGVKVTDDGFVVLKMRAEAALFLCDLVYEELD